MRTIEYRCSDVERSQWNVELCAGEPDKVQWQDEETGLPCLAVRSHLGSWCGYVGVSEDHPAFGRDYDDVDVDVDVHGGLTFAALCQPGDAAHSICHVVEPGENDRVWWLGFDCAHMYDLVPYNFDPPLSGLHDSDSVYRDLDYVRCEVRHLAEQLHEIGAKS